ncbi:MAG: ABC transporter ATP-binding protein [Proteobacteria bacterium]|nr:ABC transporter ATP-binding protein [Pseudomonadota bacterium]MDA1356611.1 ABC transporter ATP-binding protein [Pseudomonadota bacterium]
MSDIAEAPILEVVDATHRFGDVLALDNVSLTSRRGEFLTLLGESGSGKTTLLRIIAGLERPTRVGRISIDGEDVTHTPANKRNCTTVFQHYALFPHMSVGQNIEYGLRLRGQGKGERRKNAERALDLVRLTGLYDRRVHQLSGGQRQRVALARALVTEPAILLLDEPLGALDEKLRVDMQVELKDLHERLGITFIYVTHSQEEALTMSDRIILMQHGEIVQEGPPTDLFDRPSNQFVADFMGMENLLEGTLEAVSDGRARVRIGENFLSGMWSGGDVVAAGSRVCLAVRAERVRLSNASGGGQKDGVNRLPCHSGATIYKGKYIDRTLDTDIGSIKARIWDRDADLADLASLWWREDECAVTQMAAAADG